jgi:hypothetical protein
MAPGICVLLTIADLDRLAPLPCMDVCPVCGSDQVHGQACIATRLFRTIARLGKDTESAPGRLGTHSPGAALRLLRIGQPLWSMSDIEIYANNSRPSVDAARQKGAE